MDGAEGVGREPVQIVRIDAWSPRRGPTRRRRRLDAGRGEQASARPPTRSAGAPDRAADTRDPNGLVFDLVHVPGERGLTGHLDGVVTIDLTEADPGGSRRAPPKPR